MICRIIYLFQKFHTDRQDFDRIVKVGSYTKPYGGCGEAGWHGEGDGCFTSGAE